MAYVSNLSISVPVKQGQRNPCYFSVLIHWLVIAWRKPPTDYSLRRSPFKVFIESLVLYHISTPGWCFFNLGLLSTSKMVSSAISRCTQYSVDENLSVYESLLWCLPFQGVGTFSLSTRLMCRQRENSVLKCMMMFMMFLVLPVHLSNSRQSTLEPVVMK